MNKRESKKDLILCCGIEVMKSHGYNGTSVKDIVDAANVPKGSFYNYFESKEAFAIEALEKVASDAFEIISAELTKTSHSPIERITQFFEAGIRSASENDYKVGCFFGNMCQEMAETNNAIRAKVRHILKQKTQLIANVIEEAKSKGNIQNGIDSELTAEFLLNAWEGTLMRMKASQCVYPGEAFLALLPQILR